MMWGWIFLIGCLAAGEGNDSNRMLATLGWTQDEIEIMQIDSSRNFMLVILLPVHERGPTVFECGQANSDIDGILGQLSMISHASNLTNEEAMLRTGITMGVYVIDYCSEPLRAFNALFHLLVGDLNVKNLSKVSPRSITSVITVENTVTELVRPLLSSFQVPLLSSVLRPGWDVAPEMHRRNHDKDLELAVGSLQWVRAVAEFLEEARIDFISILYVPNDYGHKSKEFLGKALKETCMVNALELSAESELKSLARYLATWSAGHVVVVLADDYRLIMSFFSAYLATVQSNQQLFVVNDQLLSRQQVQHLDLSVLLVGSSPSFDKKGFVDYVSTLSLQNHDLIANDWFQELWQYHFRCSLSPTSSWPLCTGKEALSNNITLSPSLDYMYLAIKAASDGFQNFLTRYCNQRDQIRTIDDCGHQARSLLSSEIHKALIGDKQRGQRPLTTSVEDIEFLLYYGDSDLLDKETPKTVATWQKGSLSLTEGFAASLRRAGVVDFPCTDSCAAACPEKAAQILASQMDLTFNFRLTWGLATASLSALGIVAVIICFFFFVAVIPNSKGTAVLNYVILVGLFALYGVNFAFITTATDAVCAARRFVLGVAYAVVFSAKLIKVVDIWRRARRDSPTATSCLAAQQQAQQDQPRPAFILFVCLFVAFFQAGTAAAWLVLDPPRIVYDTAMVLCAPGRGFDEGLVLSVVYVMLLMALTFGFSMATWKCETHHRESRWILLSTILNGLVWVLWTLIGTQADLSNRNPAIVIGNILCATVVLVCLYAPKIYLYTKLLKQAKKLDIRAFYPSSYRGQQTVSSLYDPLPHGSVNSVYSTLTGTLTTTTNSERRPKKKENERKENVSSLRKQEFYPRPVYDGRSQFLVDQRPHVVTPRLSAIHDLPPPRILQNPNEAAYF